MFFQILAILKNWLNNEWRPKNKGELTNGIKYFWNFVLTQEQINAKIDNIQKVLAKIILRKGKASGH